METAKLFKNGRSQAVRLPKKFRFDSKEVYIKKFEDILLLIPYKYKNYWDFLYGSIDKFTDDFMNDYKQPKIQRRKNI